MGFVLSYSRVILFPSLLHPRCSYCMQEKSENWSWMQISVTQKSNIIMVVGKYGYFCKYYMKHYLNWRSFKHSAIWNCNKSKKSTSPNIKSMSISTSTGKALPIETKLQTCCFWNDYTKWTITWKIAHIWGDWLSCRARTTIKEHCLSNRKIKRALFFKSIMGSKHRLQTVVVSHWVLEGNLEWFRETKWWISMRIWEILSCHVQ